MARSNEPIVWSLFAAGGTVAALLVPVHILLLGIALPLGWVTPDHDHLASLVAHPMTKLYLLVLVGFSLFHWAHRFRYTLVDFGLKVFAGPIALACYATATLGVVVTVAVLVKL